MSNPSRRDFWIGARLRLAADALSIALFAALAWTCRADAPPESAPPDTSDPSATQATDQDQKRSEWQSGRPRSDELRSQRLDMVRRQIGARGVSDKRVLAAMLNVPRHWFVPHRFRDLAHTDRPLPIGHEQTISQPYIVALMTEVLKLTPDSRVLEIGTGSGYQAAVLSEITPHVFTIEIVEPLARRAIATFERYGYTTIRTRIGDGYEGWAEHAPFDAIIVTCAPDHIPPRLLEQLAPGGRMCIPVGSQFGLQHLVRATKNADGSLKRETLTPVRFVPMTGAAQADRDDK